MKVQGPRRRRWLAAAGCLAFASASFAIGWLARPAPSISAVSYGGARATLINAHLGEATAPYGFVAGDSYAELYPAERPPCELNLVNGGVTGMKAAEYLKLASSFRFETPPAVVFLAIGTNDLLRKHDPAGDAAFGRFRANAEALVAQFAAAGARVIVAAVPPIPEALGTIFEPAAFKLYSDGLAEICARRGCSFVDPYAASRSPTAYWKGKEGSSRDGRHLSNLRAAYRIVADEFCR
ncbi:SGNH/GDSL hydrolase family protein [uncultured Enterovirga sp.]|uniref:SGNH/GDSL hydrolase family protein n=1 Tax=uncultured Enterovirga sp. TaxID=2026352 RepID=UPI0035CAB358